MAYRVDGSGLACDWLRLLDLSNRKLPITCTSSQDPSYCSISHIHRKSKVSKSHIPTKYRDQRRSEHVWHSKVPVLRVLQAYSFILDIPSQCIRQECSHVKLLPRIFHVLISDVSCRSDSYHLFPLCETLLGTFISLLVESLWQLQFPSHRVIESLSPISNSVSSSFDPFTPSLTGCVGL